MLQRKWRGSVITFNCQSKQEGVWFSANKDKVKNESGKALGRAFSGRERQTDVHDSSLIALEQYKWLEKTEAFFKQKIKIRKY